MFSGLTSLISWSGAKRSTTGPVDVDLEKGDESLSHAVDDGRLSSVTSLRVVDSPASSIAEVNREGVLPDLPQDELDTDNDLSASGCGVGPSSEESVSVAVPGFLATIGRPASTPPETLRVNPPPDSVLQQLQDQDHICSATSSSSASSNHSYTRFFHRGRTPKRTLSTRSSGPGGMHSGLGVLTPIYEPSNPDLKDLAAKQKEGEVCESSTKTHASSVHSTNSMIQGKIMSLQETHPAFLKRSLKRSLSQTSSSSLHSEVSGAPQLPPLHFRPAFTSISVGIITYPSTPSPGPPSGSGTPQPPTVVAPTRASPSTASPQRSQPNTPQSLASPRRHRLGSTGRSQRCSAVYEDTASERSFVTAASRETEPGSGVIAKYDIPSTVKFIIYPQDEEQTERGPGHVEERARYVQEQPSNSNVAVPVLERPRTDRGMENRQNKRFSESESTFDVVPGSEKRPNVVPAYSQRPRGTGTASVMSIASTTVKNESVIADDEVTKETATTVEDDRFITERWTKTLFYSSSGGRELFSMAKGGERRQYPVSSTCVLFWVGFVAPWCWLVGGWMPQRSGSLLGNGMKKASVNMDREMVSRGESRGGLKKWILPDPSSSFKTTAGALPTLNTTILSPKEVEEVRLAIADPWVRRCRIASIVGGAVLGLGLIAMFIVLAVVRK